MNIILFRTVSSYKVEKLRKNEKKKKKEKNDSLLYESPRSNKVDSLLREFSNTGAVAIGRATRPRKSVISI